MRKIKNSKGFTLMEMLIVVAIIAVLVAIMIPTFSGSLVKAKETADVANIRARYAECQVEMLTENADAPADKTNFSNGVTLNYGDKLEYSVESNVATITYKSTKLTGGNTDSGKTYTWTLNPLDIE